MDYNGIGLDRAYAVGLQADGKIIIAGTTGSTGDARTLVCRLNQNGSLDLSFGNNGWIDVLFRTTPYGTNMFEYLRSIR
ncbi:MAG: hypothetical protein IPI07_03955 [Flavobacteriales bacterium]|nr:hypothetical protein [Flavobacteriales bacterium]